jgi:flagellar basal-body rod modification protein FlgD
MAISANVVDGQLQYNYTDSSSTSSEASGTDLGYDDFLQLLCAEMQYQDPLEPTSNTEYVAQLATFSQLEATLGLQQTEDNGFASSLVGQEVILSVSGSDGKTSYVNGTVDYVTYQDGEAYLSVNDGLYPLSSLDTVAYSEYYEAATMSKTFSAKVELFPDVENLTAEYEGAVQEVRDFYDGMTDYQKNMVSSDDLQKFESIETQVKKLVEAAKQNAQAEEADADTAEQEIGEDADE